VLSICQVMKGQRMCN